MFKKPHLAAIGVVCFITGFAVVACAEDADGSPTYSGADNDIVFDTDEFTEYYTNDHDGDDGKTFRFATYEVDYPDGSHCRISTSGTGMAMSCDEPVAG